MKLSIIIPVYNEENLIIEVLKQLQVIDYPSFIEKNEIIIVNDCSSDKTLVNIKKFESNIPLQIITHDINKGKGAAIKTGVSVSKGTTILIQDADLELVPTDIPNLLNTMNNLQVEFVNGSRYMPGLIRPIYSYKRYFLNTLFTKIASILIDTRLTDIACGYKLFTKNVYEKAKLKENRFGFEAELVIKVARLKRTAMAEVPVHYFPRNIGEGKKIRNLDGIKIFWTIVKYGLFRLK